MTATQVIDGIIRFPRKFHIVQNVSIRELLERSGYFEVHSQENSQSIEIALARDPDCINDWLAWSEDKRTASGWHFLYEKEGRYTVGKITLSSEHAKSSQFAEAIAACAFFIKQEIEDIRNS
jgi:hypothetical protein